MSQKVQENKAEVISDYLSLSANIGDALQLQDFTAAKHRHYAKLLGYLYRQSLIVSHPLWDDQLIAVTVGEPFLVRGFSGAKTYEFNASVLSVHSTPYPHLHLSYPDKINTLQMRGAVRIKVKLACFITTTVSGLKVPATILDLSTSGARVQSSAQLGKVGEIVKLNFHLTMEYEEQDFAISAIIRNVSTPSDEGLATYGVEFVNIGARARIALQSCVYIMLIDKRASE